MYIQKNGIEFKIDDTGINEFIMLTKNNNITKKDIEDLLSCSSYSGLIELAGSNIGMKSRDMWVDIFYSTFTENLYMLDDSEYSGFWPQEIIKHIESARANISDIERFNIKLINEVKKCVFIDEAMKYIPKGICMDRFTVNLLIFANNCFGIGSEMILDISFLGNMSNEDISAILSHELHHMLREEFEAKYEVDEKYKGINQVLFWLESEGIADLCNFNMTKDLYEDFGYVERGKMDETLNNASEYMSRLNDLMLDVLEDKEDSNTIVKYLRENVKFHTLGYYMANIIKEVTGVERIRECVGNPLIFLKHYNEAAKITNKPKEVYIFDNELIVKLEKIFKLK